MLVDTTVAKQKEYPPLSDVVIDLMPNRKKISFSSPKVTRII